MKKEYIVKVTTRTRNTRYLVDVERQRANTTADIEKATTFSRKADINAAFSTMGSDYRNQNWEIIEK